MLVEHVRPGAEAGVQLQNAGFAERIGGRIGDLRETLAEERVDGARRTREGREGRVVAHGPDGILAVHGHRLEDHVHVFAGVSEGELQAGKLGRFEDGAGNMVFERAVFEELYILGRCGVEDGLNLLVFQQDVLVEIGNDHLSRTEAAAVDDGFRVEVDEAGFGTEDDQAVLGHEESTRTQAVAIEYGSDDVTVGKGDGRRAIPRLGAVAGVGKEC